MKSTWTKLIYKREFGILGHICRRHILYQQRWSVLKDLHYCRNIVPQSPNPYRPVN